jgi:hypothetical protein
MLTIDAVGDAAGKIWRFLEGHGPASVSAIEREVDASRLEVHMGLGWLAREGKLETVEEKRGVLLRVRK